MSEIKFICPHCGQRIACDTAYCDTRIDCPACQGSLWIPPLAALTQISEGNLKLATVVAPKSQPNPQRLPLDLWTEKDWEQYTGERHDSLSFIRWQLLILCVCVPFVLWVRGARGFAVTGWTLLGVTLAAILWTIDDRRSNDGAWPALSTFLKGFLLSCAALLMATAVFVGILYAACSACAGM